MLYQRHINAVKVVSTGRLTAAVGSLCVHATGRRNFQSVSPSNWSVRTKQEPGKERTSAVTEGNTDTPRWQQELSLSEKRAKTKMSMNPGGGWKCIYFRKLLKVGENDTVGIFPTPSPLSLHASSCSCLGLGSL